MKNRLPIIFIIIFLSACDKEIEPYKPIEICADISRSHDSITKHIHGNWEWVEGKRLNSVDNFFYFITPKTEGYKIRLRITGDSAWFFKNGVSSSLYKFLILKESDITNWPDDNLPVIAFYDLNSGVRQSYFRIKICQSYLVTELLYRSEVGSDRIYKRL